jgi:predicted 3-demethylubiquinone-9 3-methyltransferase (glyoxalase superfamily)/uncharacterized protein (DUF427 family)
MNKLTPMLWFDGQAEEAAKFYASVFKKRAKVGKPMKGPDGKVLVVPIEIDGIAFDLLNGGPEFKFNESVSFMIHCKDQKEVDYYWKRLLSGGGQESMCGWLKDKYGLSWQIVPEVLLKLMTGPNHAAVMRAFMKMRKFDVATLVKVGNHKVATRPSRKRVRVTYRGEVIADTRNAVEMREGMGKGKKTVAPVVYYVPRKDVKMDRLQRTSHSTHCPFKGDASYFSVAGGPENAVWSYEIPFPQAKAIKERLAFYPNKLEITATG